MALVQCPDCSKEISTEANACPHCGRPRELTFFEKFQNLGKGTGSLGKNLTWLITVPIIIVVILAMSNGCPVPK